MTQAKDLTDRINEMLFKEVEEVVHHCPPGDGAETPCCGRSPLELPRTDRITSDLALVTCNG